MPYAEIAVTAGGWVEEYRIPPASSDQLRIESLLVVLLGQITAADKPGVAEKIYPL